MSPDVPGWALELLRDARVARLGTADAEGQPLVVPVCYAFDGAGLYSAVDDKPKRTRALRRLRNIAENPRASVVIDVYDEEWTRLRYVIVEGRADVLERDAERARALDLLAAKYPQYAARGLLAADAPVIRVLPERVLHWRYR